jgi:hypothetical protein
MKIQILLPCGQMVKANFRRKAFESASPRGIVNE